MIQIDEIGVIYATAIDENTAPEALPGWHVNATHPVPGWDAQRVTPATPRRVFGGIPTVFYTFPDKTSFDAALATADLSEPKPVPQTVTSRQAVQALILFGVTEEAVDAAIARIPDPLQRALVSAEWRRSQTFERSRPALIALAKALGMGSDQLDQLFITAGGL
jgi:tape measure domain-containing protein